MIYRKQCFKSVSVLCVSFVPTPLNANSARHTSLSQQQCPCHAVSVLSAPCRSLTSAPSAPPQVCDPGTGVLSHEEDAVRPTDRRRRRDLASRDSYGDAKLASEELLRSRAVPHVVLRLPDVIGPRDTTGRWWTYQLWVQYAGVLRRPVPIPPAVRRLRTSYVYVADVARAMMAALERAKEVNGQAFNLALDRDFRLAELLAEMARELGVHNVVTQDVRSEDVARFFPSVYRGPVSWRRAREVLGFEPTPWAEVLSETVRFYRRALVRFPEERRRVFGVLERVLDGDPEAQRRLVKQIEQDLLDASFGKRDEGQEGDAKEGEREGQGKTEELDEEETLQEEVDQREEDAAKEIDEGRDEL